MHERIGTSSLATVGYVQYHFDWYFYHLRKLKNNIEVAGHEKMTLHRSNRTMAHAQV